MKKSDLFRVALVVASAKSGERYTANRFCEEHGISTMFLYQVLHDRGTSRRIEKAVDDFINEHVGPFRGQLARAAA